MRVNFGIRLTVSVGIWIYAAWQANGWLRRKLWHVRLSCDRETEIQTETETEIQSGECLKQWLKAGKRFNRRLFRQTAKTWVQTKATLNQPRQPSTNCQRDTGWYGTCINQTAEPLCWLINAQPTKRDSDKVKERQRERERTSEEQKWNISQKPESRRVSSRRSFYVTFQVK